MQPQILKPSPSYLKKLHMIIAIIALSIIVFGFILGWLISFDHDANYHDSVTAAVIFLGVGLLLWLLGAVLAGPYYRSLGYEIQDDEVIVRVGILTKSVKHVPYRTVTNIKINRGILDRWFFGIGTLNIQTAGMSGSTGAEESLVGLKSVQEVYDTVVTKLRRYRGAMSPTAAESEGGQVIDSSETLSAILDEVKAIRSKLEK